MARLQVIFENTAGTYGYAVLCTPSPGDVVEIREKSRKLRVFNEPRATSAIPSYIDTDETGYKATLKSAPTRDEVPVICEVPLVVEFYSR